MNISAERPVTRLIHFFSDREYYLRLVRFVVPIALQNMVTSSLGLINVLMIGQMGEVSVAAVGLANQMFFLMALVLFGINSGSAMWTAQFWGKNDIPNIRRVLSLALMLGLTASTFFLTLALFFPKLVLGIYSEDPAVIAVGSSYLAIFGWTFLFVAITFIFASVLRSIGLVKVPMFVSVSALILNALGNYVLIFGKFGFPALGVQGAAISTLVARILECSTLIGIVYFRRLPIAITPADFLSLNLPFIGKVLKPMLPVILNESFWSFGTSAYSVVYARISTEAIAAVNLVSPMENMAFVLISSIANSTAILVGNQIGAGDEARGYRYGGRSLALAMLLGLGIGVLMWLIAPSLLALYKVAPQVIVNARGLVTVSACVFWLRSANMVIIVGLLRSGGDTRYSFVLDGLIIWMIGVPSAVIAAFVFHLPVYLVYLAVMSEEILKFSLGIRRYFSRKWIHNLTYAVEEGVS